MFNKYKYPSGSKLKISATSEQLMEYGFVLFHDSLINKTFKFNQSFNLKQPYYIIKEGKFKGYNFPESLLTDKI